MATRTRLGHDDPRLADEIRQRGLPAGMYHTGGGVYVLEIALDGSEGADGFDTKTAGLALRVTRDEHEQWLFGLYDYRSTDLEGIVFAAVHPPMTEEPSDVADWVVAFLDRADRIYSAKRSLVVKEDGAVGGPMMLQTRTPRGTESEPIGTPSTLFTREQAIAVSKAFRTPIRFS